MKKIYVGNMNYDTTEAALRELFAAHGEVASVNVVKDRDTGRPRGFAFVEMNSDAEATAAIAALNGQNVDGRALKVNEARPRAPREGGNRYNNRGGGNRNRRGGYRNDRDDSDRGGW